MSEQIVKNCSVCCLEFSPTIVVPLNYKNLICEDMMNDICIKCLDQWIKEQVSRSNVMSHSFLKIACPTGNCAIQTSLEFIFKLINPVNLPLTNHQLFDNYCRASCDIVNCPNKDCEYRGILHKSSCSNALVCNRCEHEWYESSQLSFWNRVKNFKEIKSYLYKYMFTKSCPTCQAPIQKNGGCNNMSCRKCSAHFCWLCLNLNSKHPLSCSFRIIAKCLLIFSPVVYLFRQYGFFKITKAYQPINKCERWYQYLLYPFRCLGLGIRFGCYYTFCLSSAFFLYNGGILFLQMMRDIKQKFQKPPQSSNIQQEQEQPPKLVTKPINNHFRLEAKKSALLSSGIIIASGLLSYYFGNKTEYKIFLGINALYFSFIGSILLGTSF